jgi:hypothetical protein
VDRRSCDFQEGCGCGCYRCGSGVWWYAVLVLGVEAFDLLLGTEGGLFREVNLNRCKRKISQRRISLSKRKLISVIVAGRT